MGAVADIVDGEAQQRDLEQAGVAVGLGWYAALEQRALGATLRLSHPDGGSLAIEITMSARGPLIRASAAALELEAATEISARCDRFSLEARESVTVTAGSITHTAAGTLRAEGRAIEVEASGGDVRIHANDDVQVLGEQVLLNCEREASLPTWLPRAPQTEVILPRADSAGETSLFDHPAET